MINNKDFNYKKEIENICNYFNYNLRFFNSYFTNKTKKINDDKNHFCTIVVNDADDYVEGKTDFDFITFSTTKREAPGVRETLKITYDKRFTEIPNIEFVSTTTNNHSNSSGSINTTSVNLFSLDLSINYEWTRVIVDETHFFYRYRGDEVIDILIYPFMRKKFEATFGN